MGKLNKICF